MPLVDAAASRSATAAGEATVLLGDRESGDEPVIWRANISLIAIHGTQNEHLQRTRKSGENVSDGANAPSGIFLSPGECYQSRCTPK
jgi:hypothetical protein